MGWCACARTGDVGILLLLCTTGPPDFQSYCGGSRRLRRLTLAHSPSLSYTFSEQAAVKETGLHFLLKLSA